MIGRFADAEFEREVIRSFEENVRKNMGA